MRKLTTILILVLLIAVQAQATKYEINKTESSLKWTGKKVAGEHYGTIEFNEGSFVVNENTIASGMFNVNMQSMVCTDLTNETWNQKLVNHLKGDDFFSTEKHPVSVLKLTESKHLEGNKYEFQAELTIKGISQPISFEADVKIDSEKIIAKGTLKVDRTLYNIKYGSGRFFESLGNNMIDDNFTLDFTFVAVPEIKTASVEN